MRLLLKDTRQRSCSIQQIIFYTYDEDGSNRRDNISDWALEKFRAAYGSPVGATRWVAHTKDDQVNRDGGAKKRATHRVAHTKDDQVNRDGGAKKGATHRVAPTKLDIFHYVYGLLHSPEYREKYSANLRLELPRIPMVKGGWGETPTPRPAEKFWAFVTAGERLAGLHVNYESQPEYKLELIENPNEALSWRVEKMRLSKDKTAVVYNEFLTIGGIPPEAFEYKLGTRSALEWVIERYQVMEDKRSGIINDPNRADDPEYIVKLIRKVITVSLETVRIIASLPGI